MLLEDLIDEYLYHCRAKGYTNKTMINKRQELKQVKIFLKEKRGITALESVTVHDLKAYVRGKQKSGLKPQSVTSMAKMVKAFFNWCVKEEYLIESPMTKVELPRVPKLVLNGFTTEEVTAMINSFTYEDYISTRNKAMIAMMVDTGIRAIELLGITMDNVGELKILVNGKGNKERIVFISPALKKILIKYERIRKEHFRNKVTSNHYFLSYKGAKLSHVGLWNMVRDAGRKIGIEGKRVSPHTFRHYFATESLKAGIDVYSLSRLLGHSEIGTTERYLRSLTYEALSDKANVTSPLMNMNK